MTGPDDYAKVVCDTWNANQRIGEEPVEPVFDDPTPRALRQYQIHQWGDNNKPYRCECASCVSFRAKYGTGHEPTSNPRPRR